LCDCSLIVMSVDTSEMMMIGAWWTPGDWRLTLRLVTWCVLSHVDRLYSVH